MDTVWVVILNRLAIDSDIVLGVYEHKKSARDVEKHYDKLIKSHGLEWELEVYSLEFKLNKIDIDDDRIIMIGKEDMLDD